jgi:hypothetical protein
VCDKNGKPQTGMHVCRYVVLYGANPFDDALRSCYLLGWNEIIIMMMMMMMMNNSDILYSIIVPLQTTFVARCYNRERTIHDVSRQFFQFFCCRHSRAHFSFSISCQKKSFETMIITITSIILNFDVFSIHYMVQQPMNDD